MKSKWERGIVPRNFAWVMKERLAVSERPGGFARDHRKVRRHEEIVWLRNQGFTRVVSIMTSPHNLHAYDELGIGWSHLPFAPKGDARASLAELYPSLQEWLSAGERVLIHDEELSDRLMGVVCGYLLYAGVLDTGPQAISVVEQILARQMGPSGRELVALAATL